MHNAYIHLNLLLSGKTSLIKINSLNNLNNLQRKLGTIHEELERLNSLLYNTNCHGGGIMAGYSASYDKIEDTIVKF